MTPIWRYLTKPAGMTAKELAEATGMTIQAVRADLVELEAAGKARRLRASVGQAHVWWRSGSQPLNEDEVMLHMALAAQYNASPEKLKEILVSIGRRAAHAGHKRLMLMCASAKHPHAVVWATLNEYELDVPAQKAA